MKVAGSGKVKFYEAHDEVSHPIPDNCEIWNESVCLAVWDNEQNVYAWVRVGHEPGRNPGMAVTWSLICIPRKGYKYYDSYPLVDGDLTPDSMAAGQRQRYRYDGNHHWTMADDECNVSANLVMKDFHKGFCFWPEDIGEAMESTAKDHIEASGTVDGSIKFQGEEFLLRNALAYRVRSWGPRVWGAFLTHRWTPTLFGEDLSLQAVSWAGHGGENVKSAYVIKDGEIFVPKEIDIVCYSEIDSMTHRGGRVVLALDSGEVLECEYETVAPGAVSYHHNSSTLDALCRVTMNGRQGVGIFETTCNPMAGTRKVDQKMLINGRIDNGIFSY